MRRRVGALAAALLAAVGVSGCGGSSSHGSAAPNPATSSPAGSSPSPSPVPSGRPNGIEQLPVDAAVQRVLAVAAAQRSVHVSGTIHQHGRTLGLDVHAGADSGEGTLRLGGGRLDLRLVAGTLYLRGDPKALKATGATPQAARSVAGRWVKESLTGDAGTASLLVVPKLFHRILGRHGRLGKGADVTLQGVPAYRIVDLTRGGALYVRTTGDPLPIKLAGSHGRGSVRFDEYDAALSITAPANAVNG